MRAALLVVVTAVVGCISGDSVAEAEQPPAARAKQDDASTQRTGDSRDQYQLVEEIIAARQSDAADRVGALDKVRRSWQGNRYTWEVGLTPALCRRGGCNVLPFDHNRGDAPIVQGWLPELEIDDGQHAAVLAGCAPFRACVMTITATLRELRLSGDQPTSMAFFEVEFGGFREAGPDESWIRRRRPSTAAGNPGPAPRRTSSDRRRHG